MPVTWLSNYADAKATADQNKKPLLIDFFSPD